MAEWISILFSGCQDNIKYSISPSCHNCVEWIIMIFLNQILFKYYENLEIRYILYYLDIHQKELKSIWPLFLNPGTWLLFAARSTYAI